MPTFDQAERFRHEYSRLSASQKAQFRQTVHRFVRAFRAWEAVGMRGRPEFPVDLRVKPYHGRGGGWELTWAGDGRCLWDYAPRRRAGQCHVIWLRIGSHEILEGD